jgi:hypothetical protein
MRDLLQPGGRTFESKGRIQEAWDGHKQCAARVLHGIPLLEHDVVAVTVPLQHGSG